MLELEKSAAKYLKSGLLAQHKQARTMAAKLKVELIRTKRKFGLQMDSMALPKPVNLPEILPENSCKEAEEAVPSSPDTTEESEVPQQVCADDDQAEDPTQEAATELVSDSAPDHYDMSTLQGELETESPWTGEVTEYTLQHLSSSRLKLIIQLSRAITAKELEAHIAHDGSFSVLELSPANASDCFTTTRIPLPIQVDADSVRISCSSKRQELTLDLAMIPKVVEPQAPTPVLPQYESAPIDLTPYTGPRRQVTSIIQSAKDSPKNLAAMCAALLLEHDHVVIDGLLESKELWSTHAAVTEALAKSGSPATDPNHGHTLATLPQEAQGLQPLMEHLDNIILHLSDIIPEFRRMSLMRSEAVASKLIAGGPGCPRQVDTDAQGHGMLRILTCVMYLNLGWIESHHGQLLLHPNPDAKDSPLTPVEVEPKMNRLVMYWSDGRVPTEVMPASHPRYAVSVWYTDALRIAMSENKLESQLREARMATWKHSFQMYSDMAKSQPGNIPLLKKLVDAALRCGHFDEAVAAAGALVALPKKTDKQTADAFYTLGVALQTCAASQGIKLLGNQAVMSKLDGAAAAYCQALVVDEHHTCTTRNLLTVFEHMQMWEELHILARRAIKIKSVPFENPMQRPTTYIRRLAAKPWWSPSLFPFVTMLERNFLSIAEEIRAVMDAGLAEGQTLDYASGTMKAQSPGWRHTEAKRPGWRQVVADGAWRELVLYGGGEKIVANCQRCPKTCALLDKIPEATSLALAKGGEILISILEPGTHLRPHCGPSNNRLTLHMGLVVPLGCTIRVGDKEPRSWEQGRCLVFDDSFEHEVWNKGTGRRAVLMMNFWHPDITEAQKECSMNELLTQTMEYSL